MGNSLTPLPVGVTLDDPDTVKCALLKHIHETDDPNLSHIVYLVAELVTGRLKDRNCCHRMLVGSQGIGKSTFLHSLENACHLVLGNRVKVAKIDLSNPNILRYGLVHFMARQVGCKTSSLKFLETFLKKNNLRFLLLLDELQELYTDKYTGEESSRVWNALSMLINRVGGFFLVIATSSSPHGCDLVYGEMKVEEAQKHGYVRYVPVNSVHWVNMSSLEVEASNFEKKSEKK